jgi:hypothetical protein
MTMAVCVSAAWVCHALQVLGLANRKEADDFIQARQKYVLGAVHFVESPSKQLQYIIQSNTSVSQAAALPR